jgi:two-component system response regulator HydG
MVTKEATLGIEVIRGSAAPRILELFDSVVLGREPGVEMRVMDPSASRRHATITPTRDGTGWILIDLNSSNGTFLNGRKIDKNRVGPGDIVQIGDTHLRIFDMREGQRQTVVLAGDAAGTPPAAIQGMRRAADQGPAILIGSSHPIQRLRKQIETIAGTEATVLISGPTGTGKELAARMLHEMSHRRKGPFVAINCAAITPNLVESELFGHEKGAFTGADRVKPGKFELASGGTLFLDEIGEMPMEAQAKLLRAMETRTVERVGGTRSIPVDTRFVAATNRNLMEEMSRGTFREDLFFRLCVVTLQMPALVEHREDIEEMARHFLGKESADRVAPSAWAFLQTCTWPGNVRELKNVLEAAALMAGSGPIQKAHMEQVLQQRPGQGAPGQDRLDTPGPEDPLSLRESERRSIQEALDQTGWNKSAAARRLGISRPTLHKKIREFGLKP